jgi:ketosteroid isomerase-like protein
MDITAAVLRWYADLRTQSLTTHLDISDDDMAAVFVLYHCDVDWCFGTYSPTLERYVRGVEQYENGYPQNGHGDEFENQLRPLLEKYRRISNQSSSQRRSGFPR